MSNAETEAKIKSVFKSIYEDRVGPIDDLKPDSILLDTGLDSLGFAILVAQLEDELGYDPFSLAEEAYYPKTYGEFIEFYLKHRPG